MTLHPGLVGQRVIVRRVVRGEVGPSGGPALTDVLGVLEAWDDETLSVRRADGELVTVRLAEVVAGKQIPPPARRRVGRIAATGGYPAAMDDFVMRRWQLSPRRGPRAPLHVHHGGDEGFIVVEGRLEVTLGNDVARLETGDFVIVRAGTPHTFATVEDEAATVVATMTPQIDELVKALHEVPPEERDEVWARYDSTQL